MPFAGARSSKDDRGAALRIPTTGMAIGTVAKPRGAIMAPRQTGRLFRIALACHLSSPPGCLHLVVDRTHPAVSRTLNELKLDCPSFNSSRCTQKVKDFLDCRDVHFSASSHTS